MPAKMKSFTVHHLDQKSFPPLYKALVRTHLDYASSVWAPWRCKHIDMIEGVQRRATKQIPGLSKLSYPERLKALRLPTLTYRRHRGDMIEVFKILNGIYNSNGENFLKLNSQIAERDGTRGNSRKLFVQRARLDIRKYNFSVRVARIWNSLPDSVVRADTLNTFKNRLDRFWCNQEVLYNYKADITTGGHTLICNEIKSGLGNERQESSTEDPQGT